MQSKWLAALAFIAALSAFGQAAIEPEVTIAFSNERILLGEPVWVLVTARNDTATPLTWNPGDYCFMESTQPVTAVVPKAAPGNAKEERCEYGARGGNCSLGGDTATIAPGESATWRFLLEGDFHFTTPGVYQVELTSHPGKTEIPGQGRTAIPEPAPVTQALVLEVVPRDDKALLAREEQMSEEVEAEMLHRSHPPTTPTERETYQRGLQNARQTRGGLAKQPVPGMEAVFEHWLQLPNDFEGDAILGLRTLNTKESRAALAQIAMTPSKPNSFTQDIATAALGDMGDPQYYPLMVQLLTSPDKRVRREAISGLGSLGGDRAVPKLAELAVDGNEIDGLDARGALGDSKSRVAVQALIDLMVDNRVLHPLDTEWDLFVLTHHRLPQVGFRRTAQQTHDAWQQWWNTKGTRAQVYSPFECAPKDALQ